MNERPHGEADCPGELHPEAVRDGRQVADGGHAPLVVVFEWPASWLSGQPAADHPGDVRALLDRRLRDPRQVVQHGHIPNGEDLWVAGQTAVRQDGHPACPVGLRAGRVGQHGGQRGGLHAGCPDLRPGRNAHQPTGALNGDAVMVYGYRRRVQEHLHAHAP